MRFNWCIDGKSCIHIFPVENGLGRIRHLFWNTTMLSWIQSILRTAPISIQFRILVQSISSFHILHPTGYDIVFVRVNCRDNGRGCSMCTVPGEYCGFVSISGIWSGNTRIMWCRGKEYEKGGTRTNVSKFYFYTVVGGMTTIYTGRCFEEW